MLDVLLMARVKVSYIGKQKVEKKNGCEICVFNLSSLFSFLLFFPLILAPFFSSLTSSSVFPTHPSTLTHNSFLLHIFIIFFLLLQLIFHPLFFLIFPSPSFSSTSLGNFISCLLPRFYISTFHLPPTILSSGRELVRNNVYPCFLFLLFSPVLFYLLLVDMC